MGQDLGWELKHNKPEFLPENPYPKNQPMFLPYKFGCQDTLKSLVKWLFEPCNEHPCYWDDEEPNAVSYYNHRYQCHKCMQELKEWDEKL